MMKNGQMNRKKKPKKNYKKLNLIHTFIDTKISKRYKIGN